MRAGTIGWPALSRACRGVLVELLVGGPRSRADLARRSSLSPASLTRITRMLMDVGLITETGQQAQVRTGRPSLTLDVQADAVHLVGVNLTGHALHLVRTDMRARLLHQEHIPLRSTAPEDVADLIAACVAAQQRQDPQVQALGVSLAGPISLRDEVVRASPFLSWQDVPLVDMVTRRTGLYTVVENDVRALTATAHWFGAAAGISDFLLVTIGAGVGCGMVVDNEIVDGHHGGSGQIGHLPVTDSGPWCERGHRGCARSYLASSSITAQVAQATGRPDLTYAQALELAGQGHPIASRIIDDAGMALGRVIGAACTVTAPEKVLVSGEGVGLVEYARSTMQAEIDRVRHWTMPSFEVEVVPFTSTQWARSAAVIALRRILDRHPASDISPQS